MHCSNHNNILQEMHMTHSSYQVGKNPGFFLFHLFNCERLVLHFCCKKYFRLILVERTDGKLFFINVFCFAVSYFM